MNSSIIINLLHIGLVREEWKLKCRNPRVGVFWLDSRIFGCKARETIWRPSCALQMPGNIFIAFGENAIKFNILYFL